MHKILFILIVFILCSCKKEHTATPQPSANPAGPVFQTNEKAAFVGKWDSYKSVLENGDVAKDGPSYCVLFNYEQGFELLENNSYQCRYTTIKADNAGTWNISGDSIIFYHTEPSPNAGTLSFKIIKFENNELHIKNKSGLTHYLKRTL